MPEDVFEELMKKTARETKEGQEPESRERESEYSGRELSEYGSREFLLSACGRKDSLECLEQKLAVVNEQMEVIVNSIPGGIASYRIEGDRFIPEYYSTESLLFPVIPGKNFRRWWPVMLWISYMSRTGNACCQLPGRQS